MIILSFLVGLAVGCILTVVGLYALSKKLAKICNEESDRRTTLYGKATSCYTKAAQLFETAKIWFVIGNKKDGEEAYKEAERLIQEAKQCEEEANGNDPKAA